MPKVYLTASPTQLAAEAFRPGKRIALSWTTARAVLDQEEIMQTPKPKKPFYKRPLVIISMILASPFVAVALLLVYAIGGHYINYHIDASKLPPEHRWVLKHMGDQQRIEDMVENPWKYRQLPCAKVRILDDAYCFDRSRMGNMSIATSQDSGEFYAFKFSFISNLLPTDKTAIGYQHAIGWVSLYIMDSDYDVVGEDGAALSAPHRMVYHPIVGVRENESEQEKYEEIYRELLRDNNNKLVDIVPFRKSKSTSIHSDERVFIEDNIPVAIVKLDTDERVKSMDSSWKYTGKITPYAPAWQPFYIDFGFQTRHGESRDEVRLRYIRVAKEIWQFIEDSKLH